MNTDLQSIWCERLADSCSKVVFSALYKKIISEARKMFGCDGAIGMDITEMFNDMPLVSVLMFQKNACSVHPEDMVNELLQQAYGANRVLEINEAT